MRRCIAVVAALGLLVAACASPRSRPASPAAPASAGTPSTGPTQGPRAAPPPAASPEVAVPQELRFEAPLLSGGTVRGATYAGADLVIWFWAPW